MLTAERRHFLSLRERTYAFICPPCIITVSRASFHLRTGPYLSPTARYWKDPYTFRPERFLEDWPRDAFLAFSSGKFGPIMTIVLASWICYRCPGVPGETVRALDRRRGGEVLIFFRFFETESIAVITMMMLKYRVEIKEEPEFIGETFEQRFARITSSEQKLTNTYAICSFSCCHGLNSLSAPLACRWYSGGDERSIESSLLFISSDSFYYC
jgi:hypothetical protein